MRFHRVRSGREPVSNHNTLTREHSHSVVIARRAGDAKHLKSDGRGWWLRSVAPIEWPLWRAAQVERPVRRRNLSGG